MLYILLQLAFLVAIPHSLLAHGWRGIDFTSPFGQLALAANLGWLSSLLYVDAVISPSGSEFVGTAEAARQTYALAKNRLLPKYFLSVPGKSGVPRGALLFNFVLGLLVLIPLHSWITLVTYLSDVFVLTYAVSAVAAGTFRSAAPTRLSGWIPGIKWIAPVSFILSTEIAYWSGWSNLRAAFPVTLVGVVLFYFVRGKDRPLIDDLKAGSWLAAYLLVLVLFSGIGSFGGRAGSASRGTRSSSRSCRPASTCGRCARAASTSRQPPTKTSRTRPRCPTRCPRWPSRRWSPPRLVSPTRHPSPPGAADSPAAAAGEGEPPTALAGA